MRVFRDTTLAAPRLAERAAISPGRIELSASAAYGALMKTKAIPTSLMPSIGALCGVLLAIAAATAQGQWHIPRYLRYHPYLGAYPGFIPYQDYSQDYVPYQNPVPYQNYIPAPADTANRIPYPILSSPGFYYYYDPINRAYPFTPEPIWRAMFPGIGARMEAEAREFGVPGMTANELAYWRSFYRDAQSGVKQGESSAQPGTAPK